MGFLGLGRSPLKHADPKRREQAVRDLPAAEQGQLIEFALGDADAAVRLAAAVKVHEPEFLAHLARHKDEAVAKIAKERLANVAVETIKTKKLGAARPLLDAVTEQSALVTICLQADDQAVRDAAFDKLLTVAEPSAKLLGTVAIQEQSGAYGERALPLIDKRQVLKDISKKAKSDGLRAKAAAKIEALDAEKQKPGAQKQRQERLRRLGAVVDRAEALAAGQDWQGGKAAFATLELEQREIVAAYPELGEDKNCADTTSAIARARGRWEAARTAALEAAQAALPVAAVEPEADEDADEAPAAAEPAAAPAPPVELSPLEPAQQAKLETLQAEAEQLSQSEDWKDADYRFKELDKEWRVHLADLGSDDPRRIAFLDAYHHFKDRRRADRERRDEEHVERLKQMEALCIEADQLAAAATEAKDLDRVAKELKALQRRWRDVGKVPASKGGDLRKRFRTACDAAYAPVKAMREARDWERFNNVPKAEELIARARALLGDDAASAEPTPAVAEADAVEPDAASGDESVPSAAEAASPDEPAAAAGGDAPSALDEPVVAESAPADPVPAQPAPAEATANEPLSDEAIAELERLHRGVKVIQGEWKSVGPLPRERNDELWGAFKTACDRVYAAVQPLFAARDAQREEAAQIKESLIMRLQGVLDEKAIGLAGSMADIDLQAKKTESVKTLQAEWKAAGPAPRNVDQKLWKRFKVLLDSFYDNRREHFKARDEERVEALNQKLALIVTAKELAEDAERYAQGQAVGKKDEAAFMREVKDLQKQFREIGHVPRERYEQVRDDFKAACDRVYAVLEPWFAKQDEERAGNLEQKQALIKELEELLEEERPDWFKDEVKAIQQKWKEIGQVPRQDMVINDTFRELCDRIFDKARSG